MRRVWLSLVVALCLAPAGRAWADTHPFSVHDMLAMQRIADPRVSPDGKLVAFTVSVTDLDANKRRNDIYLADVAGTWVRRLTQHEGSDTSPRWAPDGKTIYFLSTRSAAAKCGS
jgi:dipeptidyl aminopeptidase/acylaminoacyl peptidase